MQIPVSFASTLHQAHCCQLTSLQTWYGRRHVTTVICPRQLSLVVRAVAEESAVAVGQVVGRRQLLAGFAAMTVDTKQVFRLFGTIHAQQLGIAVSTAVSLRSSLCSSTSP